MDTPNSYWKKCSSCKKEIPFGAKYYVCSVSTCNGERTGYVFCSVPCFEVHLPTARHRDAGAVEKTAPKSAAPATNSALSSTPQRRIITSTTPTGVPNQTKSSMENEVLVVVSKMKQYIRDLSGMNTSEDVNQIISHMIRIQLDRAIENAKRDGRKTVMARDFKI